MNNLLVGNGLLIQFGGIEYTNKSIVLRALESLNCKDFPKHIIIDKPLLAKVIFAQMFKEIPSILNGDYNVFANCSAERASLEIFVEKYKKFESLQMSDIGFEDYYLICDLLCHKTNVVNPEQFRIRETLKYIFLYAIYNDGKLCNIYKKIPKGVVDFFKMYDYIYTTNYDINIEQATSKKVAHIHGSFFEKSDLYDPHSFRNQLSDHPFKDYVIDENFFYLYSNVISAHCGNYKKSYMEQAVLANKAIEKLSAAYNTNEIVRIDVDSWKNDTNSLIARLYDAVQLKLSNPNIKMSEPYHIDEFQHMEGNLDIVGLSPYNDFHIFEAIDNNDNIKNVVYYFFNDDECELIKVKLKNHNLSLSFKSVKALWEELK